MFSWIIEDLVKDAEGVSLPEKLLGALAHKFHITPKDIVYSVTRVYINLPWDDVTIT